MPELPEVETTRRLLAPALAERRIVSARVLHPRMVRRQPDPAEFATRLEGRMVRSLARRGKFLLFDVGEGYTWVTHLGMSGRMAIARATETLHRHTRVVIGTDGGPEVRMVDPRTFGFMAVFTGSELADSTLARLGPDALTDLPPAGWMVATAQDRRIAIKTLLLDQRFISGLGNIYTDEVLFQAGVNGSRPAGSLDFAEMASIRGAIRSVLEAGLEHGGTSLDDLAYLLPDGRAGRHLEYLAVYGREGRPCRSCRSPIRRSVIGGRSSYRCHTCQA